MTERIFSENPLFAPFSGEFARLRSYLTLEDIRDNVVASGFEIPLGTGVVGFAVHLRLPVPQEKAHLYPETFGNLTVTYRLPNGINAVRRKK